MRVVPRSVRGRNFVPWKLRPFFCFYLNEDVQVPGFLLEITLEELLLHAERIVCISC
jgi:hypothetical protein